jgi:hypothetical protein
MYKLVSIKPDDNKKNKMVAVFKNKETNRNKTVHFGAVGYDDYTKTKDKEQRERYLARHSKREDFNNPLTAGALSANILWGSSTSVQQNIKAFKKKFNL